MKVLYVLTMAFAFSEKFNGNTTWYYGHVLVLLFWTAIWIIDVIKKGRIIDSEEVFYLKEYFMPYIFIASWSVFIWVVNTPEAYNSSNMTRMISNILLLLLLSSTAISATHFWGRKAIALSAYAIVLSIVINSLVVIPQYGMNLFITYFITLLFVEVPYGTVLAELVDKLEVQGPTMAAGAFLLYYLLLDRETNKKRKKYIIIIFLMCIYIGFKRTVIFALLISGVAYLIMKSKITKETQKIGICALIMFLACFVYDIAVKYGLIEKISEALNIDTMGRVTIYRYVAEFFEFSPLFIGNGFGYVSKYLYDLIGFVAHSEIVRMLADLGLIPYILWLYHYLFNIPVKTLRRFGKQASMVVVLLTCYLFATFFMENTLISVSVQYTFLVISIGITKSTVDSTTNRN